MQRRSEAQHGAQGHPATLDQPPTGPGADSLHQQGGILLDRFLDMPMLPIGQPLRIVGGKVSGLGTSATVVGTAEIGQADGDNLLVTLHESLKKGFIPIPGTGHDTTVLWFHKISDDQIRFTSSEDRYHRNANTVLRLTAAPTPTLISFQDENSGKTGSIAWDAGKRELTIKFSGDANVLVLSADNK
jgi:hypothetical protein